MDDSVVIFGFVFAPIVMLAAAVGICSWVRKHRHDDKHHGHQH